MLVLAMNSIDAYPLLAFADLTCHLEDKEQVFCGRIVPPDSKDTKLGSSDQEAAPSAVKNNRVVLVQCLHVEVHPYCYFWLCGYFSGPWM